MVEATTFRVVELLGDWRHGGPAAERLAATVRTLVLDGRIPVGTRLPAERPLAAGLGVSRATVTAAYDRLRDEGYLTRVLGAGSWVTIPATAGQALDDAKPAELDMTIAALPAPAEVLALAADAIAKLPRWLDHHGYAPLGLLPLREKIAARYTERGLPTTPDQILVTGGAMQAIDLAIRALLPRGRNAMVELPSYPAALDAIRNAGARLRAVPVSADGWDLGELEALVDSHSPALSYLIPEFHNPTGAVMDEPSRRRVLALLGGVDGYVIADETFVELNLEGVPAQAPLASYADSDRLVTVGSLSKAAWGGLRIGWARADAGLIRRLASARSGVDLSSPVLEQLVATEVLGEFDTILAERRALARAHRDVLAGALADRLPDWRHRPPSGGLAIWVELPQPFSTSLAVLAREHGVALTPGPRFGGNGLLERYLRLPFTARPAELQAAVSVLAEIAPRVAANEATAASLSKYAV